MKLVILTSSRKGTASYCLPLLSAGTQAEIAMVIFSKGVIANKRRHYWKKLNKIRKIGLLGAVNGIRLRGWFEGKGLKHSLKDIAELCSELHIPFFETPSLGSPETVKLMKEANADLGLSLGNSYIPKKVFSVPVFGMLNIHGEVLPDFQNAQSVIWQIYESNSVTGYTIHKIDSKIDTGDILKIETYPILFQDNLENTVKVMADYTLVQSGKGLVDVINNFNDYSKSARPQGKSRNYTTPSLPQFIKMLQNFRKLKKSSNH